LLGAGLTVTEAGYTLTVQSGTVFNAAGTSTITAGVLAFGSREAILSTATGQTTTINSVVTGGGGLTITGTGSATTAGGTLALPAANSIAGQTFIDQGTVNLGSAVSISTGALTITSSANTAANGTILQATRASPSPRRSP